MGEFNKLKEQIKADIYENETQDISGQALQDNLLFMTDEVDEIKLSKSKFITDGEIEQIVGITGPGSTTEPDTPISDVVIKNIYDLLDKKVDKVSGKQLSTNDYTTTDKNKLASLSNYDDTEIRGLIANKVDKVEGKGLSTNDYTTTDKNKLASLKNYTLPKASATTLGGIKIGQNLTIESDGTLNANVNGQDITIDTSLSTTSTNTVQNKVITAALNKKVDKVTGKGLSTNDLTDELLEKINQPQIQVSQEVQQSDTNPVSGDAVYNYVTNNTNNIIRRLTETEYNNLETKNPNTLYIIVD